MLDACLALLDTAEEKELFTAVYNENKRLIFYLSREILRDEYLAEDVAQEVFLRLAENFPRLAHRERPALRAWCVAAAKNRALDLLRRRRETPAEPDAAQADPAPVPEDAVIARDSGGRLLECIAALPPRYREPLLLLAQEFTCVEIAAALGLTEAAVRQRIHRGRALLWKELHPDDTDSHRDKE